jgi:hypothetical protein
MRGSEPQSADEFTVYFTDFTNIDRQITLVPLPAADAWAVTSTP